MTLVAFFARYAYTHVRGFNEHAHFSVECPHEDIKKNEMYMYHLAKIMHAYVLRKFSANHIHWKGADVTIFHGVSTPTEL